MYLNLTTILHSNYKMISILKTNEELHPFLTLVFATSQFEVSLSSSHFLIHSFSHLHCTGSCHISQHAKLQPQRLHTSLRSWLSTVLLTSTAGICMFINLNSTCRHGNTNNCLKYELGFKHFVDFKQNTVSWNDQ